MLKIPIHAYRKAIYLGLDDSYLIWVRLNLISRRKINLSAFNKEVVVNLLYTEGITTEKKALILFQKLLKEGFIQEDCGTLYIIGIKKLCDLLGVYYSFKDGYHNIRTKRIQPKSTSLKHLKRLLSAITLSAEKDRRQKALFYTLYNKVSGYIDSNACTYGEIQEKIEKLEDKKDGKFTSPYYYPGIAKKEFLGHPKVVQELDILESLSVWEECNKIEKKGSCLTIREEIKLESLRERINDNSIEKILHKRHGITSTNIQKFIVYIGGRSTLLGSSKQFIRKQIKGFVDYLQKESGIETVYSQWMNVSRSNTYRDISCKIFQPLTSICRLFNFTNVASAKWILDSLEKEGLIKIHKNFIPSNETLSYIYYKKVNGVRCACVPSTIEFLI